ncbi:MAG TPA: signal peptidase II [Chloroflexota bacterium]|nr:signal peptidase II [Chloroflexota bacterium]
MRSEPAGKLEAPARAAPGVVRAYAQLVGVALAVFLADQISKRAAELSLSGGQIIRLVGGAVLLDYTRNTGAAFGVFKSAGGAFVLIAAGVSLAILGSYRLLARSQAGVRVASGLILGGAVGNMLDRLRLGYVVDFIDLRWWPVFNLADSAIVLGVGLFVAISLRDSLAQR